MTANHVVAPWGYNSAPTSTTLVPGQQSGYRRGRLYPVTPSTLGSVPLIRPYVIPWTPTVDRYGVAFPAGLVGVATVAQLASPLTGDLSADLVTKWGDLAGGSTIVAVPGVLPGGYTASPHVPFRTAAWSLARLPTAAGWTTKTWLPNATPYGQAFLHSFFYSPSVIAAGTNRAIHASWPGWRNLKLNMGISIGSGFSAPVSGSYRVIISHNADGSAGSSTGDLNTIDVDHTFAAADFTSTGPTTAETGYVDLGGPFNATLGVLSQYVMRVVSNTLVVQFITNPAVTDTPYSAACSFGESNRVDIPYPVTLVGQGDLIAPGGYP